MDGESAVRGLCALFSLCATGVAIWKGVRLYRIRDVQSSTVAGMKAGLVELKGRAEALDELTSPFSGQRCVWYEFEVEEFDSRAGDDGQWRRIQHDRGERDFLLEDETGRVLVRPGGASVYVDHERSGDVGRFDDASPEERAMLDRVGISDVGALGFNRRLRFSERRLDVGASLYVLGRARRCGEVEARGSGAKFLVDGGGADFVLSAKDETSLSVTVGFQLAGAVLAALLFAAMVIVPFD